MSTPSFPSRRQFLRASFFGSLAAATAGSLGSLRAAPPANSSLPGSTRVALTTGGQRADLAFRAAKPFENEIRRAIGHRRIVIKPNNVSIDNQLAATHAETLEGLLEFFKSIGKINQTVIAESAAAGPTFDGFENYHYTALATKYGVKLIDLDQEPYELLHVFDEQDFRPHPVRMSRVLLDPDAFVVSAARLKTHDRVVATLSLKNIIFGAPIKDAGFRWGNGRPGAKNDKPIAHGSGFRAINFNLFQIAQRLHPHFALIDGFEGMEGNGPVGGTAVDHRVCVAGMDWLAADRVAVALMGIDYAKVAYLNYCAEAGLGQADLTRIEVVGPRVADHTRTYRLSDNIEQQCAWQRTA